MADDIFNLENVHYSYLKKFPALNGISIKVSKGARLAILGANGSGKSTLLQMLDGLVFPDKGKITGFGKELNEEAFCNDDFSRMFRKKVGFVFQNPDIQLFCPTVKDDILFGPLHLGGDRPSVMKKYEEVVNVLGINDLVDRAPYHLSIGEKRKVAIATVLAMDTEVILLDEPTAGLDPKTVRIIVDIILEEQKNGKTVITATHDLHVAEELADEAIILGKDKKIVHSGKIGEILPDMELLNSTNLIHVHRHKHDGDLHMHPHQHLHFHRHS